MKKGKIGVIAAFLGSIAVASACWVNGPMGPCPNPVTNPDTGQVCTIYFGGQPTVVPAQYGYFDWQITSSPGYCVYNCPDGSQYF